MISETGVSIHIQQVDRNGIWTLLPNTDAPADRETGSLWSFRIGVAKSNIRQIVVKI
jgi:hypothetical protein